MKSQSRVLRPLPEKTIDHVKNMIELGIGYQILSLGGGVQSACLWLMNMMGLIQPRAEFAVFSDTGWERKDTYAYLDYLDMCAEEYGFPPIMRVTAGDIRKDTINANNGAVDLPFYTVTGTKTGGKLNRQCTGPYKIEVVKREVRRIFGMVHRVQWIGFSMDEISRRNDNTHPKYITPRYPLLEMRWDRAACERWFIENNHAVPVKSSCIGCPLMGKDIVKQMKDQYPDEFEERCEFDENIRKKAPVPKRKDIEQLTLPGVDVPKASFDLFVDDSRIPQRDVDFSKVQDEPDPMQDECQGGCHL